MNGMASSNRGLRGELTPSFIKALEDADNTENRHAWADLVRPLVEDCCHTGASDIHLLPHAEGMRVRIRVDGAVWDAAHLSTNAGRTLVNQFKAIAGLDPIVRFTPQEAHASVPLPDRRMDLRLALAPTLDRETVTVRLLDPKRLERSLTELGLSRVNLDTLKEWLDEVTGMFVATGPTGSGKTTTLYSLLQVLKTANRVVLSLEDPVEYQIDGIAQIQVDSLHNLRFAEGIKALLRHDPDFMMLGEIRDSASAQTAVQAAIAGRVLLTTMHSRDCAGAVTALRNWGLSDPEIAESLAVVVAQRLVRKNCTNCCERRHPTEQEAKWLEHNGMEPPSHLWEGKGCEKCRGLGYRGRTGVYELWRLDDSDYQMILRHVDERRLRMHLFDKEHSFLLHEACAKLEEGLTTFSEIRRVAAANFAGLSTSEKEEDAKGGQARLMGV